MATVQSETKCEKCGYYCASRDFNCRSSEEYIFCYRCGFSLTWTIKDETPNDRPLTRDDYEEKRHGGNGYFYIGAEHGGSAGDFDEQANLAQLRKDIKENNIHMNSGELPTEVFATIKKDDKWFLIDVIKNRQVPYPDDLEKYDAEDRVKDESKSSPCEA